MHRPRALALLLAALTLPVLGAVAATDAPAPAHAPILPDEQNAIAVNDAASPSVVQIQATWTQPVGKQIAGMEKIFGKEGMKVPPHLSVGAGVVWDVAGHVVTSQQVGGEAGTTFKVTLADGSRRAATLLGADATLGISVLKLDGPTDGLHPIVVGASRGLRVGQRLYVIGNAYGSGPLFSTGMLGALERTVSGMGRRSLVLNVAANPGDAGGAVLDTSGRLVGLIRGIYSGNGSVGFALVQPCDDFASAIPRLIAGEHIEHAVLGISVEDARSEDLPDGLPPGVAVIKPDTGGAGEHAGLLARDGDAVDVITAIDGVAIRSFPDLAAVLDRHRPGDACDLTVWRAGKSRTLRIALGNDQR